jgi:hypothetical protein
MNERHAFFEGVKKRCERAKIYTPNIEDWVDIINNYAVDITCLLELLSEAEEALKMADNYFEGSEQSPAEEYFAKWRDDES